MTPETFIEQFETFAEAPSGVAKLRELILQLAVQGKLVPQDENDEPAEVLLPRIREERIKRYGANRATSAEGGVTTNGPFPLPSNWCWVPLASVLLKLTDGTHRSPPNGPSGDFKYISAKNIRQPGVDLGNVTYISAAHHAEIFARCDPDLGDVLYVKDGATTGNVTINDLDEPFSLLSSVALLKIPRALSNRYLLHVLRSPFFYDTMRGDMTGVAITRVTLGKMERAMIPLPPLAEQRRIVLKVDELLGLCDELAARQAARREARLALVGATLDRLVSRASHLNNSSPSPRFGERGSGGEGQHRSQRRPPHPQPSSPVSGGEGSKDMDASRLRDHFDRLFDTPTTIPQLRQAILQLAVQGQLVPQDPNDEPAEVLLSKIHQRRRELVAEGKLAEIPKPVPLADGEVESLIPEHWRWARLNDLVSVMDSGWSPACDAEPTTDN